MKRRHRSIPLVFCPVFVGARHAQTQRTAASALPPADLFQALAYAAIEECSCSAAL
jgi:hypothetical protein